MNHSRWYLYEIEGQRYVRNVDEDEINDLKYQVAGTTNVAYAQAWAKGEEHTFEDDRGKHRVK